MAYNKMFLWGFKNASSSKLLFPCWVNASSDCFVLVWAIAFFLWPYHNGYSSPLKPYFAQKERFYDSLPEKASPAEIAQYKAAALYYANQNDAPEAMRYTEKYLWEEFNTDFLLDEGFESIKDSPEYKRISQKYIARLNIWSFIYFYIALIGFYIAFSINFRKKIDPIARILVSSFIFIHSFFLFHICLNISNHQFKYPHLYLMSHAFLFLYGPLLYFYFKRITQKYVFKKRDLLHLLPTVLLLIYLVPIYALPAEAKLGLMLERIRWGHHPADPNHVSLLVFLKLSSLIVYGYFILRLYLNSKKSDTLIQANIKWQRNVSAIYFLYILLYLIYGISISNDISYGVFYHTQIICLIGMVVYFGYSANVQPKVYSGLYSLHLNNKPKYNNSGLSKNLANELKEKLLVLFNEHKIYKQNNISLEALAEKLNTSRHGTSQLINEHFEMTFNELVNTYRVQEAQRLLHCEKKKNSNIIDIAYEVGYNNKTTFNKAFKKRTNLTPREFKKKGDYP